MCNPCRYHGSVLEFLKSIGKLDNVIIAESAANGPTLDGFSNYGYFRLAENILLKWLTLIRKDQKYCMYLMKETLNLILLGFPDNAQSRFIYNFFSQMKTHDLAVVTLSLKNIVFGSQLKISDLPLVKTGRKGQRMINQSYTEEGPED